MENRKLTSLLAALLFWAAGTGPALAGGDVTSATALRADLTDQMLRALAAAPALAPQAATQPPSTATQAMTRPKPAAGRRMVITARPTSATLALRQAIRRKPLAGQSGITSATRRAPATLRLPPPALPAGLDAGTSVTRMQSRVTTATLAQAPALNSAMLKLLAAPPAPPAPGKVTPELPADTVRINHADAEELREKLKLDGTRARLIVQFRTLYGPFKAPEDLSQVSGITEEMAKGWDEKKILYFD